MDEFFLTSFNRVQEMRRSDFEVYHYRDSDSCNVTLHRHDFYEMYCLLAGSMDYLVAGCRYTLTPGRVLFIAPGDRHRPEIQGPAREFERIVLWMNPQYVSSLSGVLPRVLRAFQGNPAGWRLMQPDEKTYQMLLNLLYALLYEKDRSDADSLYVSHLILTQLLIQLSRLFSSAPAAAGKPGMRYGEIIKVYDYVNENFQKSISVKELAELFYMDKNTLTRQFKRIIGLTPGDYIRRKRLEWAHALIRQGAGVLEAGYQSGFADYSAFYRAFRQAYGVTPREVSTAGKEAK